MAEKVTVRFEQFDSEASGDIISSGPVVVDGQLETTQQLGSLVLRGQSGDEVDIPENALEDSFYLESNAEGYKLLVADEEGEFSEYEVQNGSYFFSTTENLFYEFKNNEWLEKPSQSLVYYIRKVTESVAPGIVDLKFRGAYFSYRELTDSWQEILLGTHTHVNKDFLDRLGAVDIDGPVGTKKFFTLEVKDTDDSEATYEYDLNWEDFPNIKGLPETPEGERDLYLGYDEDGNPEWKNDFIAAQTFQLKTKQVTSSSISVTFEDVLFDSTLDEVLVLAGKFFVYNRTVSYNAETKVLTVNLVSDEDSSTEVEAFEAGETISVLIIRNGASAILDSLAKDYITKAEAVTLLSGGSVNLNDYAKKTDLRNYAKKYHTHSQFARADHDHDYRYAMFNHTHDNYLTRQAALSLIEKVIGNHPDILTNLQAISDYLVENSPELVTLATKTDLEDIQNQIDIINSTFGTRVQTFLNSEATVQSERVITNFADENGDAKNLDQVLTELRADLDDDYGNIHIEEVFLKEEIPVILGEDEYQGNYEDGDVISEASNLTEVLTNLFQRRIIPTYQAGELQVEFDAPQLIEVGETIEVDVEAQFVRRDSGLLNRYEIFKTIGSNPEQKIESFTSIQNVSVDVAAADQPTILRVEGSYETGLPKYDNIDTYFNRTSSQYEVPGKILAGDTNITVYSVSGRRALFHGGYTEELDLEDSEISSTIRNNFEKAILASYTNFEIESIISEESEYILFAMPNSEGSLSKILYKDQGNINIIDKFSTAQVSISGANGSTPIFYKVYYYKLPIKTINEMSLVFKK